MNVPPGNSGDRVTHAATGLIGLGIAACVLAAMGWLRFHDQISRFVIMVRHGELAALAVVLPKAGKAVSALERLHPHDMPLAFAWSVMSVTGAFFRPIAAAILSACTVLCVVRAANNRFPKKYGHEELQREVAKAHPIGAAWVGRDLPPKDIDPNGPLLPLDPDLAPIEWINRYARNGDRFSDKLAIQHLGAQCGAPWAGVAKASPQTRCLAAAFALHRDLKTEAAQNLLGALSLSVPHRKEHRKEGPRNHLNVPSRLIREVNRVLRRYPEITARIDEAGHHHYFETGVLLTLLQQARLRAGILNPGMFSPVQFYDRNLWLVLQAATFPLDSGPYWTMSTILCVESVGAIAHWQRECVAGRAITQPAIDGPLADLRALARNAKL